MSAPAANARRRWLFVPAVVIALALGVCLGALATYSVLGYEPASSESDAEHNHDHDHAHDEHDDHAHDDHSSEDHAQGDDHGSGSIELSAQARRNIGLVVATVEKRPFDRSILVPAMVVERPGRSELDVTAALGGIVTRIYPIQGEAVAAGAPLFDLRLTHEELVQSQSDFLKTANELDVVRREVRRLEPLEASGSIAIKTILDRRYEQEKLEAVLRSQHQALLLHGLSEAQINTILVSRQLLSGLTITVPESDEYENVKTRNTRAAPLFQVQQLFVEKGQFVNAGDQLCILSDHAQVYIEGRAFEQDAPALNQAAEKGWPITAVFEVPQGRPTLIDGLTILYVADRVEPESRTL
ncbi:MAG TPA: efflux RND transporter periplasmic adaptor subunit, partial [Pirellulales bacterium]|nr:efflux RND transporter periplasmic adaptor subunit [Pirellulales bacterium]